MKHEQRVGLLPLYIALYDELLPALRDDFAGYLGRIAEGFDARGMAVCQAPICCVADEFSAAVKQFEDEGLDTIVTLHLAYSPSLESIDALCATPLPVVMLDSTMDAAFGIDVAPERLMQNHGVHGVMDLASMLRRRGKRFAVVAGHDSDPSVLDRAAECIRLGAAAGRNGTGPTSRVEPSPDAPMQNSRILRIGDAFAGMGDFSVDLALLQKRFGIAVDQIGLDTLDRTVADVREEAIDAELATDIKRFDCELDDAVHRQSIRVGLGLRVLLTAGGYDGFSINFQAFDRIDRAANTMPFLEISKAMARGIGYAGEGDVLTAALVGALARKFEAVTFTEVFCPDWTGNSLFLSHMGEISPSVAGDQPRICGKPAFDGKSAATAVLTCSVKPGPAVFVNLAPGPDNSFSLIVAPVDVVAEDDTLDPAMRDTIRAWIRPQCKISDFLEAYSYAGGTHHSALVLGDHIDAVADFGRSLGVDVVVIQ